MGAVVSEEVDDPALSVISLGAGVQSTVLALMACEGELPKPEAAIFADTRWEPRHVYQHLDRLEHSLSEAGIPLYRVSAGNLRDDALDPGHRYCSVPYFIRNPDGSDGMGRRQCSVICTISRWLIMALHVVIKEKPVDLRRQLMEGCASVPRVGSVIKVERIHPPFVVLDPAGAEVVDVTEYLRDLALGDGSLLTCRSYAFGLLRWFRLLWLLGLGVVICRQAALSRWNLASSGCGCRSACRRPDTRRSFTLSPRCSTRSAWQVGRRSSWTAWPATRI